MSRPAGYPGRWLVGSSYVLGAVSLLLVALWLLFAEDSSLMCDFETASSFWGTAERSWFPPGTTCTWEIEGFRHVDRPDPSRLAVLAMAVAGIPLGRHLRRLLRPEPPQTRRTRTGRDLRARG
ncbi:hypothetical protein G7072_01270 [Nocardioides sp. HDW12B]|uniref:hypothetical protein n=1 Tax=Nocardioides sp. HDW12B TaxID=2714939 RepID=UPI00140D94B0|nr:hypothetical protein [Nocardioides sp. HDW12B]QIK65145.1 hypothetical protein G7072_01270 [Nocardioides sp. HDW12B]